MQWNLGQKWVKDICLELHLHLVGCFVFQMKKNASVSHSFTKDHFVEMSLYLGRNKKTYLKSILI